MGQKRIRFRLMAILLIVLLLVAGGYGIYTVSTYSSRWFGNTGNTRYRAARSTVIPGDVLDRNGIVLASSDEAGNRIYNDDWYTRCAMVHIIGDPDRNIPNAVDSFQASYLWGFQTSLSERIQTLISGEKRRGDNVTLTVDARLQTQIAAAFASGENTRGKTGAVVVLNYRTGEILVLLSIPNFDPMGDLAEIGSRTGSPYWNRAVRSVQAPGSTFKIITAVSALQHLPGAATTQFDCTTGATKVLDQIIPDYGNGHHGMVTLSEAFRVSCNNTFAQAAMMIGDQDLRRTAEAFGFNDNFLFRDLVVENSVYPTENRNSAEVAWSGIGQSRVAATPLHMCMVASAIANEGVMMEPRMLLRVTSPTGIQRQSFAGKEYRTACDPQYAARIESYMKDVVARGTGRSAAVEGLSIAGKTGSAESSMNNNDVTHAWFVGYIDEPEYPYAVCVLVENGGTGGSVAAPLAKEIFTMLTEQ